MEARLDYSEIAPGAMQAMRGLEAYMRTTDLEAPLLELVRLRASQINGCAYCVDMHTKDARLGGETEQRLYAVSVWQETPFFSDRERAALLWTETLTLLPQTHAPDDVYEEVRQHFTDKELVDLTLAITVINTWNRFGVGFRDVPGSYVPKPRAERYPV